MSENEGNENLNDMKNVVPKVENLFSKFGLDSKIIHRLDTLGYTNPSEIQSAALPFILKGKDLVGKAKTGSGKTACFLLPVFQRIIEEKVKKVLIISPTRELSQQIIDEAKNLAPSFIKVISSIGGKDIKKEISKLQSNFHFVVGTPGRIIDHMEKGHFDFNSIDTIIIDEADRLFDMGFLDDTRKIFDSCGKIDQTLLFSATFNAKVMNMIDQFMVDPENIEIKEENTIDIQNIDQSYISVSIQRKRALMYNVFKEDNPTRCIMFARTKAQVELLFDKLHTKDYKVGMIHGGLPQHKRDKTLKKFKEGKITYLVATDIASRGLHVDDVSHVINFDIPDEIEDYIHRVGRTARMGNQGKAISFITDHDGEKLHEIEKFINMQIPERKLKNFITGFERKKERKAPKPENLNKSFDEIDEKSKEGTFGYIKTQFEKPKGFGDGL